MVRRQRRRAHAGQGGEALGDLGLEALDLGPVGPVREVARIARLGQRDLRLDDVRGAESQLDAGDVEDAAQQQARGDDEYDREGHLGRHQDAAEPAAGASGVSPRPPWTSPPRPSAPRLPPGHQAAHQADGAGDREDREEHRHARAGPRSSAAPAPPARRSAVAPSAGLRRADPEAAAAAARTRPSTTNWRPKPPRSGTEGGAHRHLATAAGAAGEEQTDDVDAGDDQHQPDDREKEPRATGAPARGRPRLSGSTRAPRSRFTG